MSLSSGLGEDQTAEEDHAPAHQVAQEKDDVGSGQEPVFRLEHLPRRRMARLDVQDAQRHVERADGGAPYGSLYSFRFAIVWPLHR